MAWDEMSYSGNYSYRSEYDFGDLGSGAAAEAGGGGVSSLAGGASPYIAAGLAAYQIYQGFKQAEAIRRQADVTRQLNEMNAKYLELDAWHAEQDGQSDVARYQGEIDKAVGEQKVQFAASNVDVNYGTAAEVQGETRLTGVLNQMEMQNRASMKAAGLRRQAVNVRFSSTQQSIQANANADTATVSGFAGAAQTGLSMYSRK